MTKTGILLYSTHYISLTHPNTSRSEALLGSFWQESLGKSDEVVLCLDYKVLSIIQEEVSVAKIF